MLTWLVRADTELSRGIPGRENADETPCPSSGESRPTLADWTLAVRDSMCPSGCISVSCTRISWPCSGSMLVEVGVTGKWRAPRSQSGRALWREVHVRVTESVRVRMFLPKEKKGMDRPSVRRVRGMHVGIWG